MTVTVVVGNPKPKSKTLECAVSVATALTGAAPDTVIDVVELGPGLLGWGDPDVKAAVETVKASSLVVFASPTYKATYTGLLKLFLDQIQADELLGVTAIPLMLGGGPKHYLAPELSLKPVLAEIGASCPTRALYLLDSDYANPEALEPWLSNSKKQLSGLGVIA